MRLRRKQGEGRVVTARFGVRGYPSRPCQMKVTVVPNAAALAQRPVIVKDCLLSVCDGAGTVVPNGAHTGPTKFWRNHFGGMWFELFFSKSNIGLHPGSDGLVEWRARRFIVTVFPV
jgi:hypothetical protein